MALGYGSRGSEVKALQKKLNKYGAGLAVDGIWGPKTQAAYKKYGSKLSSGTTSTSSAKKTKTTADYLSAAEKNKPTYTQSSALKKATQQLTDYEANKPAAYVSQYGDQIQEMLDQILNRKGFTYDFSADPMFQQYKDQYTQQGQLAMMDTIGQGAALSGGYGNSYAQTAGQQVYNQNLQQLNNILPELQQAAYEKYSDEGTQMQNQLGILQGLDESDYGRYQDTVSNYFTELNYLYTKTNDMSEQDYNYYLNNLSAWQADRDYWLNKSQAEQEQTNWQTEWDHKLALEAAAAANSSSSSGGSSGGSSSKSYSGSTGSTKKAVTTKKTTDVNAANNAKWEKAVREQAAFYKSLGMTAVANKLLAQLK